MDLISRIAWAAALGALLVSCTSRRPESVVQVIDTISPYSSLSDSELDRRYLVRLLELQALNKEMEAANQGRQFNLVHVKAKTGLASAYGARDLARHMDDPQIREERLEGIGRIIADLEKLVEFTR